MMGVDDIISNFTVSYIVGSIPTIKDWFSKEKGLREQMDTCYQRALASWCKNDSIRKSLSLQMFSQMEDLCNYIKNNNKVNINELVKLWAEELRNDEKCYTFIIENKLEYLCETNEYQNTILNNIDQKTNAILNKINDCIPTLIARGLKIHKPVEGYIRRYCASNKGHNDFIYYVINDVVRHTLADFVIGAVLKDKNKFILYSGAQTGKTTELRNLCWELQRSELYLPVSFEVKTSADLKQEQMPRIRYVESKEVVVIIDALDEINGKGREELLLAINSYAHDNPDIKMVLSCRSNYHREDNMDHFQELYLMELSYDDAQEHINKCLGLNNLLVREIQKKELAEFAKHPFFLNILIDTYKNSKVLPKNRAEVYQLFIEKSYNLEKQKKAILPKYQTSSDAAINLLERLALAMSLMNKQTLTEDELNTCLGNDDEKKQECLRYNIIKYEDEQYSFEHNAFREWLVAFYLYKKGIETAKILATHPNGRIKPEWYNIIMLWTSMYPQDDHQQVIKMVEWLKTASLELLIYSDHDILDEDTKNNIFIGIMLQYKALGIRMANILSNDYKNMLDFGQSNVTVKFIANELEQAKAGTAYFSDLMCMCLFLNWDLLKVSSEPTFDYLLSILEKKTKEELQSQPTGSLAYIYLENAFFAKKEYVEKYFTIIQESEHYDAIKAMMSLIHKANVGNDYVDYILAKEKFVHNQYEDCTTHVVSRHEVYRSLSTVGSVEGVNKILMHDFRNPHYFSSDEWQEYSEMMKKLLNHAAKHIKAGNTQLAEVIENSYLTHFGERFNSYSRDANYQELLVSFRKCYQDADLVERAKAEFDNKAKTMLTESANYEQCEKLYSKTGLWLSVKMLDEYYSALKKTNYIDNCFASRLTECPYTEVADAASQKNKGFFPEPKGIKEKRLRRERQFNEFIDYNVFQKQVLESLDQMDSNCRNEQKKRLRNDVDDVLSDYVYKFTLDYVDKSDTFLREDIIRAINNKEIYDTFFMKIISESLICNSQKNLIDENCKNRCFETAKKIIESLAHKTSTLKYSEEALQLMLKGYFKIEEDELLSLLPYSFVSINKSEEGSFPHSYSLFDYLVEHVSQQKLSNAVVRMLKNDAIWKYYQTSSQFVSFIIDNRIEKGYPVLLNRIVSDISSAMYIAELMLKADIMVKEIKAASNKMNTENKLTIYNCMQLYPKYNNWIKDKLEPVYQNIEEDAKIRAIRILLKLGSIDALAYLTSNPKILIANSEFNFCYSDLNAVSMLAFVLQYLHDKNPNNYFTNNSILNSFERIAIKNANALNEVKTVLSAIVAKNEYFKYLNRYIIMFENKYYEQNTNIKNIDEVMKIIDHDAPRTIDSNCNSMEKQPCEPIYVSYNWESKSNRIVDYFCYVLNTHHIPFRRDKNDCKYMDNIKEFMDAIQKGQKIVIILSRPYLKSKNCMYELTSIMQHDDFQNRILPVVTDDGIRDPFFYVELGKHWKAQKDEKEELVKQMKEVDPLLAAPLELELKEVKTIYRFLVDIKSYIDWTNADALDSLCSTHFKSIIDKIKPPQHI